MFTPVDLLIVLGAQLLKNESGIVVPSDHLYLRLMATSAFLTLQYKEKHSFPFVLLSGGYNCGVRYSLDTGKIMDPPDFSFGAFSKAREIGPSESFLMKEFLIDEGVKSELMVVEESSATTLENAKFCKEIVSRNVTNYNFSKIGLLSNKASIDRQVSIFEEEGFVVIPIIAEDYVPPDYKKTRKVEEWENLMKKEEVKYLKGKKGKVKSV